MDRRARSLVAGVAALALLAGCDRAGLDRLGKNARETLQTVTESGREAARELAQAARDATGAVAGLLDRYDPDRRERADDPRQPHDTRKDPDADER